MVLSDTQDDPSLIRIADGIVRVWGRVAPHRDGDLSAAVELNLDRLSLDQIVHAVTPTHGPMPGRLSGTVRLIGEAQMLIGTGVALEHFVSSTVSWVRASIEFDKWLVETLGLQQELDSEKPDDGEGGGGSDGADGPDGAGGEGPKES